MAESTPARVFAQAEKRGDVPAYYEKDGGNWHPTTWSAYADQVRQAARALITFNSLKYNS